MSGVDEPGLPTLYDWAGGLVPLRRMIDRFYDRVEADEELSGFFPGGVSQRHRAHVADWWAEVLGGPTTYTDRHGGYASMLGHHLGLDISPAQRHRFAATMSLAADEADLPGDPEFRAAIIGYLEWGTRLAMENSKPGAAPVEQAPTPPLGLGRRPALPGLTPLALGGRTAERGTSEAYRDPVARCPPGRWLRCERSEPRNHAMVSLLEEPRSPPVRGGRADERGTSEAYRDPAATGGRVAERGTSEAYRDRIGPLTSLGG